MKFLILDTSLVSQQNLIGDRFISYEDGWQAHWGKTDEHPPNSWHSFACAMGGRFVSAPLDNWMGHIQWADVILLTWTYDPLESLKILRYCKKLGKKVIVAFHENGSTVNLLAKNTGWLANCRKLYLEADYVSHYPHKNVQFIHETELVAHNTKMLEFFNCYPDELFVDHYQNPGTGTLIGVQFKNNEHENRNFFGNLIHAIKYVDMGITVINSSDIISNSNLRQSLAEFYGCDEVKINVVSKTNTWYEFLDLIDKHRYVINDDTCLTQGQVTSDAIFRGRYILDNNTAHSIELKHANSDTKFKYSYFKSIIENL